MSRYKMGYFFTKRQKRRKSMKRRHWFRVTDSGWVTLEWPIFGRHPANAKIDAFFLHLLIWFYEDSSLRTRYKQKTAIRWPHRAGGALMSFSFFYHYAHFCIVQGTFNWQASSYPYFLQNYFLLKCMFDFFDNRDKCSIQAFWKAGYTLTVLAFIWFF